VRNFGFKKCVYSSWFFNFSMREVLKGYSISSYFFTGTRKHPVFHCAMETGLKKSCLQKCYKEVCMRIEINCRKKFTLRGKICNKLLKIFLYKVINKYERPNFPFTNNTYGDNSFIVINFSSKFLFAFGFMSPLNSFRCIVVFDFIRTHSTHQKEVRLIQTRLEK
jgi:hypothetical protein